MTSRPSTTGTPVSRDQVVQALETLCDHVGVQASPDSDSILMDMGQVFGFTRAQVLLCTRGYSQRIRERVQVQGGGASPPVMGHHAYRTVLKLLFRHGLIEKVESELLPRLGALLDLTPEEVESIHVQVEGTRTVPGLQLPPITFSPVLHEDGSKSSRTGSAPGAYLNPTPAITPRGKTPSIREPVSRGNHLSGELSIDMVAEAFREEDPDGNAVREAFLHECENLSLRDLLQARNDLSRIINRRFKQKLALTFADIVGSTSYFHRYGDEAGQALMQRFLELQVRTLETTGGWIVETTGDGTFTCFPDVARAVTAMVDLQKLIATENHENPGENPLALRIGIHWGSVLVDGSLVTGDAVNLCARVAALGGEAEIICSAVAYQELGSVDRIPSRVMPPARLKGIAELIEVVNLDWRDPTSFPRRVRNLQTHEEFVLPDQERISFGRLAASDGGRANDIVLSHPDEKSRQRISRWHFVLTRLPNGYRLKTLTDKVTEVNGRTVPRNEEVPLRAKDRVTVSGVVTLEFLLSEDSTESDAMNATMSGFDLSPYLKEIKKAKEESS